MKTRKLKASSGGYLRIAKSKTYTTVPYTAGGILFNSFSFTQSFKSPGSFRSDNPLFQKNVLYKGAYYLFVGKNQAKQTFNVVYDMPAKIRKLKTNKDGYISISETTTFKHPKILKVGVYNFNPNSLPNYTTDSQIAAAKQSRQSYKFKGKLYVYKGGINQIIYVEYNE
jgi:hypothetical protein